MASVAFFLASFWGRLRGGTVLALAGATVLLFSVPGKAEGWRLTGFHVGEADMLLLEAESGGKMLIDGGDIGAGSRVLLPYLWHVGAERLDIVVVSHAHRDHYGGLRAILSRVEICEFWVAEGTDGEKVARRLARDGRGCAGGEPAVRGFVPGQRVGWGGGVWSVWWPPPGGDFAGQNDTSLVLSAEFGEATLLFAGDWEGKGVDVDGAMGGLEERIGYGAPERGQLFLKAPHHGHKAPVFGALLERLRPDVVFLPSTGELVWWEALRASGYGDGAGVWLSGSRGAMRLEEEGAGFSVDFSIEQR